MRLAFILGEIGSGLRRNVSMVVSVILVTFVSLTFVGAAGMLAAPDQPDEGLLVRQSPGGHLPLQ